MPKVPVYAVDFGNGNLSPSLDTHGWGAMKLGDSGPGSDTSSTNDPQGIGLSLTAAGAFSGIGIFAVPGPGVLDLATRLLLEVQFDEPSATRPDPPAPGSPEPWAVALSVEFGDERVLDAEPVVGVTCQFRPNGVRLNTPGHLEAPDQAGMLITPLDYAALTPGRFVLQHHFCGINAARGYTIGYGSLTIGPPIRKDDQRVYSNAGLSTGQQTWIGALGVALVTIQGAGRISVRVRSFSVWIWS